VTLGVRATLGKDRYLAIVKQGRNATCACGSGKKYKSCCLRKNVKSTHETDLRHLIEQAGRRGLEPDRSERDEAERALHLLMLDRRATEDNKLNASLSLVQLAQRRGDYRGALEQLDVQFSASADGTANAFIIQPITLAAGVTMLVDPEVTIFGSIRSSDYSCSASASWCTALIDVAANTYPATGSAIMGLGVVDGRGGVPLLDTGKTWWSLGSNELRPRLVFLGNHSTGAHADNFTMYKITLKNSPKFHFSGTGNDLTIWGVKVFAPPDSPNTDGLDPSGSQNITITNSYISDGDDMIAVKAGVGHVSNVTISNNHMYSGHGITVGSETNAGLNNMYVHDDAIDNGFGGSSVDSLRIKSDTSRGGEVYDVLYKNICIQHGGDTIVIDPYYSSQTGSLIPNFHDITFSNVHELIRDSAHKPTFVGYNTAGIVNPLGRLCTSSASTA
jgi:hypothetical protein